MGLRLTPDDLALLGAPADVLSIARAGGCVLVRMTDGRLNYECAGVQLPEDDRPCVGVCGVPPVTLRPLDPQVLASEWPRLSRQCHAILDLLRSHPEGVTNTELAAVALKYTGRISEVRRAILPFGWTVQVVARDHTSGVTTYRLLPHPACA